MPIPSTNCVLCSLQFEETVDHLFMECSFARNCWSLLGLVIISEPDILRRLQSLKTQLNVSFFMEVIILLCRSIWISRNDVIFRGISVNCFSCIKIFRYHVKQLLWKVKKKYFPRIESWLEQLV
ncbi:hypothetical protein SORBI_3004G087750 [Sorghum bicolor]|uniref:Reverse transcriptase zinc-binding domain-containing protein n=1 Tax=Sorghum bicolor TaxID=4558 RepID=A0A1Z5RLJ8_SORBI|nr:hypothetical protein SORBI_3004G087750 [Sorghum bicolor]